MENPQQLLLGVGLNDDATFENFYVSDSNHQLLQFLQTKVESLQEGLLCLWGRKSAGKTHLLQATCHHFANINIPSIYLPIKDCHEMGPEILDGLEYLGLVCLDDLDQVLENQEWELALFNLYNRTRDSGAALLFSSQQAPIHLSIELPDLRSRLQSGMVFPLHDLTDKEKAAMFRMRASHMGINIPDSVVEFILLRSDREVTSLLDVLFRLDRQSLEQKRRITIPLVKQTMSW
jgi:DnaA family protein